MADITSQISTLSVKLTMYRASDNATKTRTFSVRDPALDEENPDTFRTALQNLQNFLLGDGKTLIQPTGWRDEDTTEDEYVTTDVEFTTEEGVGIKWDTRLTHNMSISPATLSPQTISSSLNAPTFIEITGTALDSEAINVRMTDTDGAYLLAWEYDGDENLVNVMLVKTTAAVDDAAEIVFEMPAEGVYQSDSVTLTITGG